MRAGQRSSLTCLLILTPTEIEMLPGVRIVNPMINLKRFSTAHRTAPLPLTVLGTSD